MKKKGFLKIRNLNTTLVTVLLVALSLISSSSMSAMLNKISNTKNLDLKTVEENTSIAVKPSTGLAPQINPEKPILTTEKANNLDKNGGYMSLGRGTIMYGYVAYSSAMSNGPCYFDVDVPETVNKLSEETVTNFLSGGTWTCDDKWMCCQYGTGVIYEISTDTGHITTVGGGGNNLNALAYNGDTNTLWGAGDTDLFQIDEETGAQQLIGPFGSDVNYIIGMAFDSIGVLYGWSINDYLWTINTSTGDATQVGPLGINLNYAQDGDFDRFNEDTLYLTAFTLSPGYGGYLYTCDKETGACTLVGAFPGTTEIDASMFPLIWCNVVDVGVKDIISPGDGYANQDMDVTVKIKNWGMHAENNVSVNVVILKDGIDEEYNETVFVDIEVGQALDVEMPKWTPDDWQSASNEYIDYKIIAHTDLFGDENPGNDYKEEWSELYFGYFNDVGCTNVIGPESGSAQTFPVNVTVKNFGQYDECCFKTYVEIAELDIENQMELLSQNFSDYIWPPDGWTVTNSKWQLVNSSYAGGPSPEARFQWDPIETGLFRLYTPAIDTGDYDAFEIEFKHSINNCGGPYKLKVETSSDGVSWSTVWEMVNPGSQGSKTESIVTNAYGGSDNFYVSWTFEGNSYNINFWWIDDIVIKGCTPFDPEYEDYRCTTTIEPGEKLELEFANWTPAYLAEEISCTKMYLVKAWTDLNNPQDENPNNDLFEKTIELNFFHDVGIKEVTSPNTYIILGNQNINVNIENIGTFPEHDMTCYAEIFEYITNCTNGTLVYEDNITNIDIEQPLGGTETLPFDDYNFAIEGVYSLDLNLVDDNDDYPDNNQMTYVIGVDGTAPTSSHTLSPANPNGDNGWYVSDITVTLSATDPSIGCDMNGSGVKEIKYTVNNVPGSVPGETGTFKIHDDGTNIEVKYWSVDNVGNEEGKHTFYINMDQTKPDIKPIEWDAYREGLTWYVKFTCQADDATSGMDRLEMYINDELNETITSPGPTYEFNIEWSSEFKTAMFKFVAFDTAGNSAFQSVNGSDIKSNSISQSSQQTLNNQNLLVSLLLKQMGRLTSV